MSDPLSSSQTTYLGPGASAQLAKILASEAPQAIFVVANQGYRMSGAEAVLAPLLHSYDVTIFSDFRTNPKVEDVIKGLTLFDGKVHALMMAVGGGTAIDLAKAITLFAYNRKGSIADYLQKRLPFCATRVPMVAIPTTAGTGSEATHFAVLYCDGIKHSLAHPTVLPRYAIVDAALSMNLPPAVTAASGMDALSQAIESYWCVNATETSQAYAAEAIRLVMQNLEAAVWQPQETARVAMAKAANLAGQAINLTFTTAPHAISYPITAHFGIPHGHAVGLVLPAIYEFNVGVEVSDCLDQRGVTYVHKTLQTLAGLMGARDAQGAAAALRTLMGRIGLEMSFARLGIDDTRLIIQEGFNPERVKNNPRRVTVEALRAILNGL